MRFHARIKANGPCGNLRVSMLNELFLVGPQLLSEVTQSLIRRSDLLFIETREKPNRIKFLAISIGTKDLSKVTSATNPAGVYEGIDNGPLTIGYRDSCSPTPN